MSMFNAKEATFSAEKDISQEACGLHLWKVICLGVDLPSSPTVLKVPSITKKSVGTTSVISILSPLTTPP